MRLNRRDTCFVTGVLLLLGAAFHLGGPAALAGAAGLVLILCAVEMR